MGKVLTNLATVTICLLLLRLPIESHAGAIQQHPNIEGNWLGTLRLPSDEELKIVFRLVRQDSGKLKGVLDSPDQYVFGVPIDVVAKENGHINLGGKAIGGGFEGTLTNESTLKGHWKQGGGSLPLVLRRVDSVPQPPERPQTPKPPFPYHQEEVSYPNPAADDVTIAGTLTRPRSEGPFPAALLIAGSGPHDRDETVCMHRPFFVLADYLTRRGIAVLRVDKRGVGSSTGDYGKATMADFASDVRAGIAYLRSREDVRAGEIGLIGHSAGADVAAIVAAASQDVSFIVMMAGTGVTGYQVIILQDLASAKSKGATDTELALIRPVIERYYAVAVEEKDNEIAAKKMQRIYDEMTEEQKHAYRWLKNGWTNQIENCLSPGCRSTLQFDPKPHLIKVSCPVLAIIGEKDVQVIPNENLRGIREALKAGGNENHIVEELPSLNHLFQTADTGALAEYVTIEETIAPIALEKIGDWVRKQTTIE
ncbi:MAG: alpha/beta hydrolase [Phycisphaerales bacterium]|nr:MAG: alpha/beta hydrolase [Phycisphaerales bacterium]